jgi:hypothetical protein
MHCYLADKFSREWLANIESCEASARSDRPERVVAFQVDAVMPR